MRNQRQLRVILYLVVAFLSLTACAVFEDETSPILDATTVVDAPLPANTPAPSTTTSPDLTDVIETEAPPISESTPLTDDPPATNPPPPTAIPLTATPFPGLTIDNFDVKDEPFINCQPFGEENATPMLDFCSYYVNTEVKLSYVDLDNEGQGVEVAYSLPPYPEDDGGNWNSIRRELSQALDLSSYSGIKLRFRVNEPTDAQLRITLADVELNETGEIEGSDELWWCDKHGLLSVESNTWQTVECRFFDFVPGDVGRGNDQKLNLQQIIAYEFTFVSTAGTHPEGAITMAELTAFGRR